eukprot:1085864-Prymnesium_polylepis.1
MGTRVPGSRTSFASPCASHIHCVWFRRLAQLGGFDAFSMLLRCPGTSLSGQNRASSIRLGAPVHVIRRKI